MKRGNQGPGMSQRFPPMFGMLAAIAAVVLLFIGMLTVQVPHAAGRSPIADVQLEGFRYVVAQDDFGAHFVRVFYDGDSVSGLQAYAAESRKQGERLLHQGVNPLDVEATFRSPLSLEEFTRLVVETGMQVKRYQIRAIDGRGDRVGIQGSPRNGELCRRIGSTCSSRGSPSTPAVR